METASRVLISGGGVAGLTAAIFLARAGREVVVVEHAPDVRADGFIISLSHRSYRYAAELELLGDIRRRGAGVTRSSYHRGARTLLELDYSRLFDGVDVLQIMRDDLQELLWERARNLAEFRFGTSVSSIADDAQGASVVFSDGRSERFDAVVGADGAHSNIRRLCFAPDNVQTRHLGLCSAAYRLPNISELTHKFETHMERDRYMVLFTTPQGGLATVFVWATDRDRAPEPGARASTLREAFRGAGSLVDRVLEHCPEDGAFYMDPLIQVRLDTWYCGRAVLIGDAAHCLTLISGQGATMAFTGACALSEQLIRLPVDQAYAAYQADLQSTVRQVQDKTRSAARWYVPRSWLRQNVRDLGMLLFPTTYFERYFKAKYSRA